MEHGFTEAEVDEQLAIRRTAFRNAVAGVTTRRSETLADALVSAAEGDFVFTRPETSQALFEATAPSLDAAAVTAARSEEHTSELQSLMRISYAVFCLKKKTQTM